MSNEYRKRNSDGETDERECTRKSAREFFLKPPVWLDVVVWVFTAASIGLSVFVACTRYRAEIWAYTLYALSLVSIVASLYCALTFGGIASRIAHIKSVKRFVADFGFRSYVTTVCSAALNALYAAFGTVVAIVTHSAWLGALVWYHIVLAACRTFVFYYAKRGGESVSVKAYIASGIALIVMSIAVAPVILLVVRQRNSYVFFGGALVYVCALALYTVIKLTASVIGRKKAKRSGDYTLRAMRNISFADALISVFALQATMFVAMGDVSLSATMNPVIGGVIAFFIAAMGAVMIFKGVTALGQTDGGMSSPKGD